MLLNPEKMKRMVIATRQKRQRGLPSLNLLLNPQLKQHVSEHRHLGVILGERSCWSFVSPIVRELIASQAEA